MTLPANSPWLQRKPNGSFWLAAKWLLIGAVGGSALTLGTMRIAGGLPSAPTLQSTSAVSPQRTRPRDTTREASSSDPATPAPPTKMQNEAVRPDSSTQAASDRKPARSAERHLGPRRKPAATGEASNPISSRSTLSEEVALLDAARMASTRRDYDATLRWIDEYRRQFPHGELTADAEVMAIEASVTKGDRSTADECASRFLHRYPNDPHTRYIQRLVEHE